jgi:predicted dienelactone hydrolase
VPVSNRFRRVGALLASLLIAAAAASAAPVAAAELLELRLDGLKIPISLEQLELWVRQGPRSTADTADLGVWLDLLAPESRRELAQLLRAPLLRDQGFGRQLLDSWAGGQMLAELGNLLTTSDGASTTAALQSTLRRLLEQKQEVSAIELLRSLPGERLSLQLDGLLILADQWRQQLLLQGRSLRRLEALELPEHRSIPLAFSDRPRAVPRFFPLAVAHRSEPLPLELWTAPRPDPASAPAATPPWLLVMPGLGGTADQLGWLAAALAERGWSSVVLQHPGSDGPALKAALDGQRPPPGAESLPVRLADVEAVLAAQQQGRIPVSGDGLVLIGHSLGGLTALQVAGLAPEPGLADRCRRALDRLPVTNPSRLLQCQLPGAGLPATPARPADLRGVVIFNGFGSLLWPGVGLAPLPVPVLLVGGTLDLITPPLQEQLGLFLPPGDRRSRLVLIAGGSHFSPVRPSPREDLVFQLGTDLVGVDPTTVQGLLLRLTTEYLQTLDQSTPLPPQRRVQEGVTAYVLDPPAANRWNGLLGP